MPDARGNSKALDIIARVGDIPALIRAGEARAEDFYTATARVCLSDDGRGVDESDEAAAYLLAPAGSLLPLDLAGELGLTGAPSPDDLNSLKKADLVAIAQDKGVDGAEAMKKAELVDALAAPAPAAANPL